MPSSTSWAMARRNGLDLQQRSGSTATVWTYGNGLDLRNGLVVATSLALLF